LEELPKHYQDLLTPDERGFFLAWLRISRELGGMPDLKTLEKRLGLTSEQIRNYFGQLIHKLNKTSTVDIMTEGLKEMGWWPLPKPPWYRPRK